jgi:hypothetical protein
VSVTFQALRRLVANQIEPESWAPGLTTATGSTILVTASRFATSAPDEHALDGGWLYFCDGALAGEEVTIAPVGLGSSGDIDTSGAFSAATPSGANFEVHFRYPVTRPTGSPWRAGYRDMLNDALHRLWIEDYLSVSGVSGQARYLLDLVTYPWLADRPKDRVFDIYDPRDATSNVRSVSSAIWHIDDDAEAPELVFDSGGYNTGDTFFLKVARPAWTRIKIAGVWTDLTPSSLNNGVEGLYADTNETHAIPEHVLAFAITDSMNHLGMRQPAIDRDTWEERRLYWARVARGIKNRKLPRKHDGKLRLQAAGLGGGMMRGGGRSKSWGGW